MTLKVSKGTYIRSIARDLGRKLGCYASLMDLRRTEIENFKLEDSVTVTQLKNNEIKLLDPFKYLKLNKLIIPDEYLKFVDNGRHLEMDLFSGKEDTLILSKDSEVLAIYTYDETKNIMRMSVKWC